MLRHTATSKLSIPLLPPRYFELSRRDDDASLAPDYRYMLFCDYLLPAVMVIH